MRHLLFLALLVPCLVFGQGLQNGSDIVFVSSEHDFGRVAQKGGAVSHVFEFTNNSGRPLIITKVVTSCRCTGYDFSKKPVPPGEKGKITVKYNPKKQSGRFHKVIQVHTNGTPGRVLLTIGGEVVE